MSVRFDPDFTPIEGTSAFIQWKGTDVCLDFWCECGGQGHYDGYFAYALKCGACGRAWKMPHSVGLIPMQGYPHDPVDVDMDNKEGMT